MKIGLKAALVAGVLIAGGAQAQTVSDGYGSAVYMTQRTCAAGVAVCDGRNIPVQGRNMVGGAGQAIDTNLAFAGPGIGSQAYAKIGFGGLGLPETKMSVTASSTNRIGNNVYTYQTYTYTGADEFDLLLNGNFHIVDSSTDGQNGTYAGGVVGVAGFAIWDASDFFAYDTPEWTGTGGFASASGMINTPFLYGSTSCDLFDDPDNGFLAGPRASSNFGGGLTGGANQNIGVSQSNCHEQTLTLYNGDQFVIASFVQLISNRGGWADATGTFKLELDPSISAEQAQAFAASIQYVTPNAVPEPAAWALMILGFGIAGSASRARSRRIRYAIA
jgi:hypothetical protein